jgi:hypothetical protein
MCRRCFHARKEGALEEGIVMSEAEVIEMMYESLGYADRNFEFWLSASFAVILAFHFSGTRLTTLMYRLITFLYCSATVLFVARWTVAAMQYASFRKQLMDMGASIEISGNFMEGIITLSYIIVISLGTVGTIYFGYKTNRNLRSGP